jgi:hypothetical protein
VSLKFQIIYKFHLVGVVSVHVHDEPLEIYIQESRSFTILISLFFFVFSVFVFLPSHSFNMGNLLIRRWVLAALAMQSFAWWIPSLRRRLLNQL